MNSAAASWARGQVGWDWLSLQLFDGSELMAYRMRRADGSTDPFSTVAWIDAHSVVRQTEPDKFQWKILVTLAQSQDRFGISMR